MQWHRSSLPTRRDGVIAIHRRGAATIEFAICAAAFFALLIGILQIAIVFFVQESVQTAAETVARKVLTGQIPAGTTQEQFRTQSCGYLPAFLKCSNLYVDMRKVTDLGDAGTVSGGIRFDSSGRLENTTRFEPAGSGDLVVLRLLYRWPMGMLPLGLDLRNQGDSSRTIVGTMVFKSEPYA
ncbi:TadE/TadG family type IV pilus assembly protein [Sphingomonas hankookensis]|uniref:TadE/TadG family type IV pilus assembly protein n=1 Tax=Sphingomonas hankookensis TaxID=563996 RepID=UPI001F57FA79|nr:TadE/TadG family type IV pilus assembly protein [Sphingomonas hankookensis]